MARFDNNASACYDRIIVLLGMLAVRQCGMPEESIQTHATALEKMKYSVKTAHGISENFYTGTKSSPLFGTGQGSGASRSVWLTMVVTMMNKLDRLTSEKISFKSPNLDTPQLHHSRLIDAFVDDTSLSINDSGETSYQQIIRLITHLAQTWETILTLSGGSLNLKKCSYYIMHWEWHNGRPRIRAKPEQQDDHHNTVFIESSTGDETPKPIRQIDTTESTRILGVHFSPSGHFNKQIQILTEKANQYSLQLKAPHLRTSDILLFHKTTYTPAMKYSLLAITADKEKLHGIQTKVLSVLLQRIGVSSKIPTAIRHGPVEIGG